MTSLVLVVFVFAALLVAGVVLELFTSKTREEMIDEVEASLDAEPEERQPVAVPDKPVQDVAELIKHQEADTPKPKAKRGRPAAKKK